MTDRHEPIVQTRARPKGEKRRSNWSLWVFVVVVLALLLTVPFLLLRPRANTYVLRSYETATVQTGTLLDYVRGTGTVVPRLERSVVSPVEGTLTEWLVAEGDEVAEGAVLGRVSSRSLGQEVADAQKEVQAAELALEKLRLEQSTNARTRGLELERAQTSLIGAETELSTTQRLFDAGAASRNDLDTAKAKVSQAQEEVESQTLAQQDAVSADALATQEAQLRLEQAQAKLVSVEEKEAGLELKAPVAGRVMKLALAAGGNVQPQAVLATVASSQDVRVNVSIPEAQASRVSVGQPAKLRVGPTDFEGSVVGVSPNAEAGANGPVVGVALGFDSPPQDIRIGASAGADIEVDRKEDALYLPRGAFLSTGGERFVYLVNGDRAVRTNVLFGLVDGNNVEVREGLVPGDNIVSSSYEAFKEEAEVSLIAEGEVK